MILETKEAVLVGNKMVIKTMANLQDGDIVMTDNKAYKLSNVTKLSRLKYEASYKEV